MSDVLNYDENCVFCKIIKGDIPSTKVYEDDLCYAFRDINPQAPTHILVVPKAHIQSVAEISPKNEALVGHMFSVVAKLARDRVISNCGPDAGQTVPHLHFHILGGRAMSEKMV